MKLDIGVFPGEQGGPHVRQIAGKAVAAKLAATAEFKSLMKRVAENAKTLGGALVEEGLTLARLRQHRHAPRSGRSQELPSPTGVVLRRDRLAHPRPGRPPATRTPSGRHQRRSSHHQSASAPSGPPSAQPRPRRMKQVARSPARVLKAIHPYNYLGGASPIGRGKLDLDVLEGARREIDATPRPFPTASHQPPATSSPLSCPVPSRASIQEARGRARLEVSGARAPICWTVRAPRTCPTSRSARRSRR